MDKLDKDDAGYQFKPNTQYECGDCVFYLPDHRKCQLLSDAESVLPFDGCTYFVKGVPETLGTERLYALNSLEADYSRSNFGFSCKRCVHFIMESWDCEGVNKDTPGDTPGMIHPDACCNLQEPDPVRGQLPTEAVRTLINIERYSPDGVEVQPSNGSAY